jgi:hypothetical protein
MSEATMARMPGSMRSSLTASALRADREGGDDRHQDLQCLLVPADGADHSHERTEHGRRGDIARRRVQDQAQPDREDRVAGDALQRPEARPKLADVGQSAEPVGRVDGAVLGVLQQLFEGGDLVEAQRAGERRRDLDGRRLAATHRHHQVRGECADRGGRGSVRRGHPRQPVLHDVDRFAGGVHRCA